MAKHQQDPNQVRLTRMFKEWEAAEQRKQMAQQTLDGATQEALVREAKFKGAIDFVGGPGASWIYDNEKGHVVVTPGPVTEDMVPQHNGKGREIVLNGPMSAKELKAVIGAQTPHRRKHR